jgi:hypothetical protein
MTQPLAAIGASPRAGWRAHGQGAAPPPLANLPTSGGDPGFEGQLELK